MLLVATPRRQSSARAPFLGPLWDNDHPEFRRIEASLPLQHHARWLAHVVTHLDLAPLRLSYAGRGSRAYLPELLVAFVLFMYSRGILSPAEWVRQARYDDQAKWLLRGCQPSRSQLYTFRERLGPYLDSWHKEMIAWAVTEQITTARRGSLDGSFVAALASRHRLLSQHRLDRRLLLLRLLVWLEEGHGPGSLTSQLERLPELTLAAGLLWLELLSGGVAVAPLLDGLLHLLALLELLSPQGLESWSPRLPAWVPTTAAGRIRVLRRYEDAQKRLAQKAQPYQAKKKLSKKDQATLKRQKVSPTDPEAALGWDKVGTFRPLYNVQLVQATDAPLTLAWDVLARNNDDGLLKPMMEKTHEQMGRHLEEVLADGAFVSVGDVLWCEQQGIVVYAPAGKAAAAQESGAQAAGTPPATLPQGLQPQEVGSSGKKEKKLAKEAFRYEQEEKVYYCPQGKRLQESYRTAEKRHNGVELVVIVYRAAGEDCQACPQQQGCTSNPKKGRVVKRYEGEEALARLRQRMSTPASQQVYKERCQSVELGYADIKEHRGLRVFRCFGRKRARTQVGLVILASNGLKIMAALRRRQNTDPALAPQEKPPT
jgi:transposase